MGPAISALVADLIMGEPPASWHPTVWMGRWVGAGRTARTSATPSASMIEGAVVLGGGLALTVLAATILDTACRRAPFTARGTLRGVVLKPALSLMPLLRAATDVERALDAGRIGHARALLGRHLVSRPTTSLSEAEVAGAAVESVAENLSDSVVAPLMAFRVGGLAAAYGYRLLNTADAMLGYHSPELEWFGKPAARADDVANLIPARVTGALICGLATVGGGSPRAATSCMARDARRTSSPNAGWPMAAMAGALGLRLTKRKHYELNDRGREPRPSDIGRACRIAAVAAIVTAVAVDVL
jgi:adenosylcobinamide-phosphate synthase